MSEPTGALRDLDQVDDDVDRDQHHRRREAAERERGRGPGRVADDPRALVMHSGQRMPTGVGVMHSGQIGRPQEEQETPVSRFGWR